MYLIDTNVFISAKDSHYGFDFCPAFWDWLIVANIQGRVFSIDQVRRELLKGDDELADWAKHDGKQLFLKPYPGVFTSATTVGDWVNEQPFDDAACTIFLDSADFWLISHALDRDYSVVTHEIGSNSLKRVKIPNVCDGVGVSSLTPFEMLRQSQVQFVLENSS